MLVFGAKLGYDVYKDFNFKPGTQAAAEPWGRIYVFQRHV
jgi:hypothetical protein